jgi:hypothetical protein
MLKQTSISPSLFETLPPANHQEWQRLGDRLDANHKSFDAGDFEAMYEQFSGREIEIIGASQRDFRFTSEGFRFVLELQPDFAVDGTLWPELRRKSPGAYVVIYEGELRIEPMTPPDMTVTIESPEGVERVVGHTHPLAVKTTNDGMTDAYGVTLIAEVDDGTQTTQVMSQTIDVLSQVPHWTQLDWQPLDTGQWDMQVRLEDQQQNVVAETSQVIDVQDNRGRSAQTLLSVSSKNTGWMIAVLVLSVMAVFIPGAIYMLRKDQHRDEEDTS